MNHMQEVLQYVSLSAIYNFTVWTSSDRLTVQNPNKRIHFT